MFGLLGAVCRGPGLYLARFRPSERGKAQALNDLLVFGTSATASFLAGFLQDRLGWAPLNWASIGLVAFAFLAVIWLRFQRAHVPV